MTSRLARTALAAVLALALPAALVDVRPAAAQEAGPEAEIKALADSVAGADDPQAAWSDSMRLVSYGAKAVQPVAEAAAADTSTAAGRVALGRVLLALRERPRAAQALLKVAGAQEVAVPLRADAIRLLAQTTDDYEEQIRAVLDSALDSRLRAACAYTLWTLTKDISAKIPLREMLRSDDPEIRVEGALALAEVGDFSPGVQEILQQVRVEPTDRGRLAAVLLEKESWDKVRTKTSAPAPAGGDGAGLPALLDEIQRTLQQVYVAPEEINLQKLWDGAAHGFVEGVGDPHTSYQDLEERDDWSDNLTKKYGGIGAYVGFDPDGIFSVTRPMFGGPAWRAGLRSGTRVLRIDDWDTIGHTVDDIVKRLRGPAGTTVKIAILKPGWKDTQDLELTREPISVPSVNRASLPGGVGYIVVENFAQDTADEFSKTLTAFEEEGAKSLVVDLRFNSGGYLNVAEKMADMLLPRGKLVVETKGRNGPERGSTYISTGMSNEWRRTVPLVVLVNEYSASASEILSGCLKVHGRAKVIGTRTFGKGSVQNVFYLYTPPFAEDYTDLNNNRAWDDNEPWNDLNRNGRWDAGEPYRDVNGNMKWDTAEPYTDRNKNNRFDAPAVKATIAKYFVGRTPGSFEFNPHRKEMIVANRRVWLGGVEPDVPVASEEFDGWRAEETEKLNRSKAFDRYVGESGELFEKNRDKFLAIATSDTRNPADWPGFEEFYASLGTKLTREEVWYWMHIRLREQAGNSLGKILVGDWAVDQQLQRGLKALMETPAGNDLRGVKEYAFLGTKAFEVPPTYDPAALAKARPARGQD